MPIRVSDEVFDECVNRALQASGTPDELVALIDNCVVLVLDAPPPGEDVFGFYDGIPLTERGSDYGGGLPDRIMIFRRNRTSRSVRPKTSWWPRSTPPWFMRSHHFGIDDAALDELGYQ